MKFSDYAKNKGRLNEMFIRNGELSTREANQRNIAKADITEAEVQDKNAKDGDWEYGLVKIGTKIWSRKDFSCHTESDFDYQGYYSKKSLEEGTCKAPKGWKIASSEDFEMMQTVLSAKGDQDWTKYLFGWDSKTGFRAEHGSWYEKKPTSLGVYIVEGEKEDWEYHSSDPESGMWYLTSDKEFIKIIDGGEMEKGDPIKTLGKKSKNSFAACAVRIVMD